MLRAACRIREEQTELVPYNLHLTQSWASDLYNALWDVGDTRHCLWTHRSLATPHSGFRVLVFMS